MCEKNAKTRKVKFDSSKQRIQGTEMAAFVSKIKQDKVAVVAQPKINWRAKHDEFMRTLKSARGEKVDDTAIIPTKPLDNKQCPYCDRNFGPKSYDRHVEFCKEKSQRRPSGPVTNSVAKKMLEARTKVSMLCLV